MGYLVYATKQLFAGVSVGGCCKKSLKIYGKTALMDFFVTKAV